MADRRMLAKSIMETDLFSDMPTDAQMLYVRMIMMADDDGFVSNPRAIMRAYGFSDDCMKLLIAKKFVMTFEKNDGFVYLIKHWRVHNYIRTDRYKASTFKELLRGVYYDENNAYSLKPEEGKRPCLPQNGIPGDNQVATIGIPSDNQVVDKLDTQVRLGKDSIGKVSVVEDSIGKGVTGENHTLTDTEFEKRCDYFKERIFAELLKGDRNDLVRFYLRQAAGEGIRISYIGKRIDDPEGEHPVIKFERLVPE